MCLKYMPCKMTKCFVTWPNYVIVLFQHNSQHDPNLCIRWTSWCVRWPNLYARWPNLLVRWQHEGVRWLKWFVSWPNRCARWANWCVTWATISTLQHLMAVHLFKIWTLTQTQTQTDTDKHSRHRPRHCVEFVLLSKYITSRLWRRTSLSSSLILLLTYWSWSPAPLLVSTSPKVLSANCRGRRRHRRWCGRRSHCPQSRPSELSKLSRFELSLVWVTLVTRMWSHKIRTLRKSIAFDKKWGTKNS